MIGRIQRSERMEKALRRVPFLIAACLLLQSVALLVIFVLHSNTIVNVLRGHRHQRDISSSLSLQRSSDEITGTDNHDRDDGLQLQAKVIPEWQSEAVVADRESEKLSDRSYGEPRRFVPMGSASFLFVHFATHRTGPDSWAVVGLGARSLFLYSNPSFSCSWHPHKSKFVNESPGSSSSSNSRSRSGIVDECNGTIVQPASNHVSHGRVYTGTVVHCAFESPVGVDGTGGRLVVSASHGSAHESGLSGVSFVAKVEGPDEYNSSLFREPYRLDHVYCGPPLYGSIDPQRIREWISYHALLLGHRSHFFLYDAGGLGPAARSVLRAWEELGMVTIMNVRQERRYDSHYHNQFVILNDCLFRSRTMAPWTWLFDMDEFVYSEAAMGAVSGSVEGSMIGFLRDIEKYGFEGIRLQRVSIRQRPMDHQHCPPHDQDSEWGVEKMVFRRTQVTEPGGWMDSKSVVRADAALAVGPHQPVAMRMPPGASTENDVTSWQEENLVYYHYHGVVDKSDRQICHELVDPSALPRHENGSSGFELHSVSHKLDETIKLLARSVRRLERKP